MKYRWSLAPAQPVLATQLAGAMRISPLLAQCLVNRGLTEEGPARRFLQPRLQDLADPFLLPNMAAAVDRLLAARAREEAVVIFGDYDVDGVTSTTLLSQVLTALGWKVNCHLPHRLEDGYGLSREGLESCLKRFPVRLLLAVDCGSTSAASIEWLREQNVEVIVLDHHQVSSPPPRPVALVNPQLAPPDAPSFRELCSAGLSFKLAHALLKRMRADGVAAAQAVDLREHLDLAALGTVADVVPLTGENRILTKTGLEKLDVTRRPGLAALKNVAQCRSPVDTYAVGFQLGPRLNAAGRLETAEASLQLLMSSSAAEAAKLARQLDECNRERQNIEKAIVAEVLASLKSRFDPQRDFAIVEGRATWHIGVVGIVASRVLQEFYRPTIILGGDGDRWRGSGRSIEGFDLAAALRSCGDLLDRHGGHAMAAGLTLQPGRLDQFRARLNELAQAGLKTEQFQPGLTLDAEAPLSDLTLEGVADLDKLRPVGQQNPPPRLWIRDLAHAQPPFRMGRENQHVKFRVKDQAGRTMEAVWWKGAALPAPTPPFDLAVEPSVNEYNGTRRVQLKLLDWRPQK